VSYPWLFESNFEAGSNAEWDSETDTGSKLDFPHYSALSRIPGMPAPYRGAYCMRIQCGDTNDHTLIEGDIDIATGATRYFRWYMFISENFAATADDNFSIFELQQAAGTQVYVVGITIEADDETCKLWVAEDDTPETTSGNTLPKGRWFTVEVEANVDTGAANGDITVYIDGSEWVSLTTAVQNAAAIGRGVLGTQATAATTTGTILFDQFVMDDARVYGFNERFPTTVKLTKSGHVFVGPGCIEGITILSTNGTADVYDTDTANTNDASARRIALDTGGNFVSNSSVTKFERGCYVSIGGTNPEVEVRLSRKAGQDGGPTAHWSDGAIRTYGQKRNDRPHNV
jgi:hypothetical protein